MFSNDDNASDHPHCIWRCGHWLHPTLYDLPLGCNNWRPNLYIKLFVVDVNEGVVVLVVLGVAVGSVVSNDSSEILGTEMVVAEDAVTAAPSSSSFFKMAMRHCGSMEVTYFWKIAGAC